METDPFYDAVATIVPIVLLIALGLVSIYSMVGVPVGITLIGVAIGMAVVHIARRHHGAPHH